MWIMRKIADLVCYAPPIALVWLPGDVNVFPPENVGLRLTLFAANFYGFRTRVRTTGTCEKCDAHTSARLRPSKTSSCCTGGGSWPRLEAGENKKVTLNGDICLTEHTRLSTAPRAVVWLRRAQSGRRSGSRLSQRRGMGCRLPLVGETDRTKARLTERLRVRPTALDLHPLRLLRPFCQSPPSPPPRPSRLHRPRKIVHVSKDG